MKICLISDTHAQHRKLVIPECDILVHAGDITYKGELKVIEDFASWLKEQPAKNKVVIFGNHELGMEYGPKRDPAIKLIQDSGSIYLEDSGVTIDGINFWGSPITPFFFDWAFNRQRGKDIKSHWDRISDNTNVLITHGPPYMIRDEVQRGVFDTKNVGCVDLLNRISDLSHLVLHVFGHIHGGYGSTKIDQCTFVNASSCTEAYKPTNPPIVVEI